MLYDLEEGGYVPLEPPQALIAEQLAMLLPAAVAMQASLSPWKYCPLRDLSVLEGVLEHFCASPRHHHTHTLAVSCF